MSEHLLVRVILLDLSYAAQRKDAIAFINILWNIATTGFYTGNVLVFQNIFKQPCRVHVLLLPSDPVLLSH